MLINQLLNTKGHQVFTVSLKRRFRPSPLYYMRAG